MSQKKSLNLDGSYALVNPGVPSRGLHLPFYPRSLGYAVRAEGVEKHVPAEIQKFVMVFWGDDGEGEFFHPEVPGHPSSILRPGHVFFRLPGQEYRYVVRTKFWRFYWLAFHGPLAGSFMEEFQYPRHCFPAGRFPKDVFSELYTRFQNRTPHDWRMMMTEIAAIIAKSGEVDEQTPDRNLVEKAIAICRAEYADYDLNINTLAARLDIDRTTLLRAFQRYMKQNTSEYLYQVRLQAALGMLSSTHQNVAEIAHACGFKGANYFCRFLKKYTGQTAAAIRRAPAGMLFSAQ